MKKTNYIIYLIALIIFNYQFLHSNSTFIVKFKSDKHLENFSLQSKSKLSPIFKNQFSKISPKIQSKDNFQTSLYFKIQIDENDSKTLKELKNNEDIEFIEQNHIYPINKLETPNDTLIEYQWALNQINAKRAWTIANGEGIIIGIVDTGIDFNHPDLINQLWINSKEDANGNGTFEPWSINETRNGITGDLNGIDDDGNGIVDDVIGYDFVDQEYANFGDWNSPDPIPEDQGNHGTSVAGIIAASANNKIGIAGLAYKSKILTAKAFDATGNAESDDIANAIMYAVSNGAKIINLSFGDTFQSLLIKDVIQYAHSLGCIIVASSGNENNSLPHFPSDYENVISVGASNEKGLRSSISNYGVNLSILAPGEDILTTAPNGDYRRVSGTSFSAPYVSAAIALLLQKNPDFSSSEIRSTLEIQSHQMNSSGWDKKTGAGILDVFNLLNYTGKSNFDLQNVQNYSFYNFDNIKNLSVKLATITPLFQSYQLEIADLDSNNYKPISELILQQDQNKVLAISKSDLLNKNFRLSLKINLKNGKTLRRERALNILVDSKDFKVEYFSVNNALKNEKNIIVVSARTNFPCNFWIEYWNKQDTSQIFRIDEQLSNSEYHILELDNLISQGKFEGIAHFEIRNNVQQPIDTILKNFDFDFSFMTFPTQNYTKKSYSLPRAYLNNNVVDLYGNGANSLIINNLQDFIIGRTESYQFVNNAFILKDTLDGWIPVGFGKTKENSVNDILLTQNAKTILTQKAQTSNSPFSNILFSSVLGKTFWGETLFDIDKDGFDEIIAYNDTTFFAYKYKDGNFTLLQNAELPVQFKKIGVTKGTAIGDFDGDGYIELMHSNYYGNIFIFKYKNGKFNLEFQDTTNFGYSNPIITKINLPGEKIPAIIIGTYGSKILFGKEDNQETMWTYRLIKWNNKDSYNIQPILNILGVRAGIDRRLGISFRNGVLASDIDKTDGDELIISAFPNTYIMKWDGLAFKPIWLYPYSFTNSAVVWDFDKNGVNEIGIATYDSTSFFEISSENGKPDIPTITESYAINSEKAIIKWQKIEGVKFYKIYQLIYNEDGTFSLLNIAKVSEDSIIIGNMKNNNMYYFLMTAIDSTKSTVESDYSAIIQIFAHNPISFTDVKIINNHTLELKFNGKVKSYLNDLSKIKITRLQDNTVIIPSTIIMKADSNYIISFSEDLIRGEYEAKINEFRDFWNTPITTGSVYFEMPDVEKDEVFYLKSLEILSLTLYKLVFSENVEKTAAENISNYFLSPWGKVIISSRDELEKNSVLLRVDDEIKDRTITGQEYSITVKNVISSSGKKITTGSGNTLSFVLTKEKLDNIITFPNPIHLKEDEFMTFGNLTKEAIIRVMDLNGKIIIELTENSGTGGIIWNLKDLNNQLIEPGIYLYKVTGKNSNGEEVLWEMKKFAVLP